MNLSKFTQLMECVLLAALLGILSISTLHAKKSDLFLQEQLLVTVLDEFSEKYQVLFSYDSKSLNEIKVNFHFRENESMQSAIERLLAPVELEYETFGEKYYVIYSQNKKGQRKAKKIKKHLQKIQKLEDNGGISVQRKQPTRIKQITSILETAKDIKKEVSVKGTVIDANGEPLIGVNVFIKGTSTGTITEVDGTYSISVPNAESVLVFSYTGYLSQEITVGNQTAINIVLEENVEQLDEVVVVGYGSVRKSDLTGSVASVGSDQLKSTPILSLDQGLQGRVAGVQVTQGSHAPGGGVSIKIRGGNSLTAGTEPLYVIDGFPIYSDNALFGAGDPDFGGGTGAQTNALSFLNPNDIESIEILKDASATAIYGSRGANGVVVITTKSGKYGNVKVDLDSYYGIQTVANKIDLLNTEQYLTILNEARADNGLGNIELFEPYIGVDTDWQDEVYRAAPIQNHQISVSGGKAGSRYLISGNYFSQDGVVENSSYDRGAIRINLDNELNARIKLKTNINYSRSNNDGVITDNAGGGNGGVPYFSLLAPPFVPIDTGGVFYIFPFGDLDMRDDLRNPVLLVESVRNSLIYERILGSVAAKISLADNLTLRISGGADISGAFRKYFRGQIDPSVNGFNFGSQYNSRVFTWLNENTINYDLNISKDHKLNFVGGFTQQEQKVDINAIEAINLTNTNRNVDIIELAEQIGVRAGAQKWTLLSWLGRVNYNLKGKYLFTLSARADGSSRFGENEKWGFFPSAAFAWRLIDEPFIKSLEAISDLKFRASYGISGNQEIGVNRSLPRFIARGGVGIDPSIQAVPANPDLRWERTAQTNIGLDASFVDNRFRFTFDYYIKNTEDLLYNLPVSLSYGGGSQLTNIGSLENRGVELSLSSNNLVGEFKWETSVNFSSNRNELTALPVQGIEEGFPINQADGHIQYGFTHILQVGEPIGNFFGYETDGIWQTDQIAALDPAEAASLQAEAGEVRFIDQNGDNVINDDDRTIIGNALPDFFLGITNNFSYKGFDLSIFLNGVFGQEVLNYQIFETERLNGANNSYAYILDRWTPENPSNTVPKATQRVSRPNRLSDRQVEDASFLRIQNLSLGYTFGTNNISWLRKARIYVSAQNLHVFTDYRGYDPEVNSFGQNTSLNLGIDRGAYPAARTFLTGVSLTF